MKKAIVADTYKNFEQITDIFQKNGKNYVTVKQKCDRCWKGIYVCRVENNQPVPHPAYGGVCLKCEGTGYIKKDVRAYTEKEKASLDRAKARRAEAAAKRAKEREEEMKKNAPVYKAEARKLRGFSSESGCGYLVLGQSYKRKEEIKEAGGKFNGEAIKAWIVPNNDVEFKGCTLVPVDFDELFVMEGKLCRQKDWNDVKDYLNKVKPSNGEWVGTIGERIRNIEVEVTNIGEFDGRYGHTFIYTFEDEKGNVMKWFTKKDLEGETYLLSGTVKKQDVYNGEKQTVLTRCYVKEI